MPSERSAGPFARIEEVDLRDDDRLSRLYLEAVRRGWWENGGKEVLDFWSLAEKALEEDRMNTPGRLFHSLVKEKSVQRVSDRQEVRAQKRMPSGRREDLVARATVQRKVVATAQTADRLSTSPVVFGEENEAGLSGSGVGFQHSVMMMCFLPQKEMPTSEREYSVRHGRALLQVQAGFIGVRDKVGVMEACPLPFGSRARLILPYINAFAVQNRSREVDLGRSLRAFLEKIGMTVDGRRGREVSKQIRAIGAAQITLVQWREEGTVTRYGRVADQVSFWVEKDARQRTLWEPTMMLSQAYYDVLLERPVPVDMGHLLKLTRSPRRMDLYSWLTYRTSRIRKGEKVRIRLADLRPVFAPEITSERHFRQKFRGDLAAVAKVYRRFRVKVEGDMLVLETSPPPIAGRAVLLPGSGTRE